MAKTKAQIIEQLRAHGEIWANGSYSTNYLRDYLARYEAASKMPANELFAKIKAQGKVCG